VGIELPRDAYQIGFDDVEAQAVEKAGRPLVELAQELDCDVDAAYLVELPADGWRVLLRRSGSIVIGAPTVEDAQTWRLAHIDDDGLQIHPDPERLRPASLERRRGLELRWPEVMRDRATLSAESRTEFVIDIVNVGDTRWQPDGDGFRVVGVFTDPGVTEFSFAWTSYGQDRAVPLDPGEYARVPVTIGGGGWATLEPGGHDLHAVLVDLNLPVTNPLAVEPSAVDIARHRTPTPEQTTAPELRQRHKVFELQRLNTQLAATAALGPLVEALSEVTSRRQALATISSLLHCDARAAEGVWMASLGELLPLAAPEIRTRLEMLQTQQE
jgi:hypothetical protein